MMVSSRFGLLSLLVWMGNLPYYPLGITLEASGWLTRALKIESAVFKGSIEYNKWLRHSVYCSL